MYITSFLRTHTLEREQRFLAASREERLVDEARLPQKCRKLIACRTIPITNMNEAEVAINFQNNEEWEGDIVVSKTLDEAARADLENEFHERFPNQDLGEDNEEENDVVRDDQDQLTIYLSILI